MSISQYRALLQTIECGTLTKAAAELGYTQSGVSHLIDSLENDCGIKLVNRDKSGATLTNEGMQLYPFFQEIVDAHLRMTNKVSELKTLDSGLVRIGTFSSVSISWLPGIIRNMQEQHPGIKIVLYNGTDEDNYHQLETGAIDCAFAYVNKSRPFSVRELYKDPIYAILPAKHPLSKRKKVSLSMLEPFPYIKVMDGQSSNGIEEITDIWEQEKIQPQIAYETSSEEAAIAMAASELGYTILPDLCLPADLGNCVRIPLDPYRERRIGLAFHEDKQQAFAVSAFIETAADWVSAYTHAIET